MHWALPSSARGVSYGAISTSMTYNRKIRLLNLTFLRCVLIVAKPAYSLRHVRPSVHLHVSARLPRNGFLLNLVLETFKKVCPENPNVVTIGKKPGALCLKTSVSFPLDDDFKSTWHLSFSVKFFQTLRIAEEVQTLRERATVLRYITSAILSMACFCH